MFEQDRVILRLQQRILAEPSIVGCFLHGSYGRATQDAFSDIDVVLVFASEGDREKAYVERREFVRSVLPYVPAKSFDADHIRPYFHVALYSNGSKVDFLFETRATLTPGPWYREIRLLKDSDGWIAALQELSRQYKEFPPSRTMTASELSELDERFWVMFMDVYRQVLRGDYDKPFPVYLQLLFFTLPELLHLLPGEDEARQDLISASYHHDVELTLTHLRQLLVAYLAAREAVVRRHSLMFAADAALERELRRRIIA